MTSDAPNDFENFDTEDNENKQESAPFKLTSWLSDASREFSRSLANKAVYNGRKIVYSKRFTTPVTLDDLEPGEQSTKAVADDGDDCGDCDGNDGEVSDGGHRFSALKVDGNFRSALPWLDQQLVKEWRSHSPPPIDENLPPRSTLYASSPSCFACGQKFTPICTVTTVGVV